MIFALSASCLFYGSPGDENADGNPFAPCPDDKLNCYRTSISLEQSAAEVFEDLRKIISQKADVTELDEENLSLSSVYTIPIFRFKDDLVVSVENVGEQRAKVHFRSSSRVGCSDLNVNINRVKKLIKKMPASD